MNPDFYDRLRDDRLDALYVDDPMEERDNEWRETPDYWNGALTHDC